MKSLVKNSCQLLLEFREKVTLVKLQHSHPLQQSAAVLPVCNDYLQRLRNQISKYRNISSEDEIMFFKEIKPQFVSEHVYNLLVYQLYHGWPMGDIENQEKYLKDGLRQLSEFFNIHHSFYRYYRTSCSLFDHIYFLRGKQDIVPCTDQILSGTDPDFNTTHDLILAKILAYDRFQPYLLEQINLLHQPVQQDNAAPDPPVLIWSDSKYALVELVYGLYLSNAFNGGKADLKTIVEVLGKTFSIELNNFYDHFRYIKMRKMEPTKFIDKMKLCLLQKYSEV